MTDPLQNDVPRRVSLLKNWLSRRVAPDAFAWLEQQVSAIGAGGRPSQLSISIGLAPRKVGKADLNLTPDEQETGRVIRFDLDTMGWSVDQAARILLLLASFDGDEVMFADGVGRVLATAEIGEQIAILRGLPLLPASAHLLPYATEGVRSAMQPIFEAVAHRNPYPREHFSDAQWNQMVVKSLFIGSRLAPIQGLDARRNGELAHMLVDYAAERRAAMRSISPELWRCVAPFAGDSEVALLADILSTGSETERQGAALALFECPLPSAKAALSTSEELAAAVQDGRIAWNSIV